MTWQLDESDGTIKTEDGKHIATMGNVFDDPTPEDIKNGRVMAASHELLQACQLALKQCSFPVGSTKAKTALQLAVASATKPLRKGVNS